MKNPWVLFRTIAVTALLSLTAGSVAAQMPSSDRVTDAVITAAPAIDPAWGTSSDSVVTIHSSGLTVWLGTAAFSGNNLDRYCTGSVCDMIGPLDLPNGAMITGLAADACDSTSEGRVVFGLGRRNAAGDITFTGFGSTGVAQTLGCMTYFSSFTPLQVDNSAFSYMVEAGADPSVNGSDLSLGAMRVYYRLQISTPPETATFDDVPTSHPLYQFIEALVASGITAGCSTDPPMFCPNASLTRGQMAVFLAKALGLHFPN